MGASKQAMMDEIHRISTQEYDEDDRAKNDDAAFCAKQNYDSDIRRQYDNDELVEVIVDLQKKVEKDNG